MSDPVRPINQKSAIGANIPVIIGLLLLVDSLHFVFARLLLPYMPPESSAFYVFLTATLQLLVVGLFRGVLRIQTFLRNLLFFVAIGFLIATSTVMNYAAIAWVDPGTAALLGKTSVLFGLGFGLLWLRERLTAVESLGSLIALIGVFLIAFQPGDLFQLGSLIILSSTFLYTLHTAIVKRWGGEMDIAEFLFFRLVTTSSFVFIFATAQNKLVWPQAEAWLIVLLVATLDVVISRFLFYWALQRLKLSFHTIILTLSPVVTILWSLMLFSESPTPQEMLGGLAVMLGVFIVSYARGRPATIEPS